MKNSCKFGKGCEYKHDPTKKTKTNKIVTKTNSLIDLETGNSFDEIVKEHEGSQNNSKIELIPSLDEICQQYESDTDVHDSLISEVEIKETNLLTKKKFSCNNCDYTSLIKDNLKSHVKSDHKGVFTCDKCEFTFHGKRNLKKHVETVHKNDETKSVKRKRANDNLPSRKKTNLN